MSEYFAVYLLDNGRILQCVQCPLEFMRCGPGEAFLPVEAMLDPNRWYIDQGLQVERPALPAQLSGNQLSGVPAGAEIQIEADSYTADGSTIELSFSLPGTYHIRVVCWPYLDWEADYEATA